MGESSLICIACLILYAGCTTQTSLVHTHTIRPGIGITTGEVITQTKPKPWTGLWGNGHHRVGDITVINTEQVPYQIDLPWEWFKEDIDGNYERGQHVFVSTSIWSDESISVQWFLVDTAEPFTLTEKFDRLKTSIAEDGLTFTDGRINEAKKYIVVNGKLSNLSNIFFTDIYFYFTCDGWSAFTDSVVVSIVYDQAHATKWQQDIDFIQQAGVQHVCE